MTNPSAANKKRLHRGHLNTRDMLSAWGSVIRVQQPAAIDYESHRLKACVKVCLDIVPDDVRKALEKFQAEAVDRSVMVHVYKYGESRPWILDIRNPKS
jgi:hypothetical protein